jgi:Flp pilus assembly protein TadG
VMLFVLACDFARVFHFSLTLTNCARAGALYASDPLVADESPFANSSEAALADAGTMTPAPIVSEKYGTDAAGREWVEVSAEYEFNTITGFPGIPNKVTLTRTVRMFIAGPIPGWN